MVMVMWGKVGKIMKKVYDIIISLKEKATFKVHGNQYQ